jgi:hypothetical protein
METESLLPCSQNPPLVEARLYNIESYDAK